MPNAERPTPNDEERKRSEIRDQRSEIRDQRSEVRGQRSGAGVKLSEGRQPLVQHLQQCFSTSQSGSVYCRAAARSLADRLCGAISDGCLSGRQEQNRVDANTNDFSCCANGKPFAHVSATSKTLAPAERLTGAGSNQSSNASFAF